MTLHDRLTSDAGDLGVTDLTPLFRYLVEIDDRGAASNTANQIDIEVTADTCNVERARAIGFGYSFRVHLWELLSKTAPELALMAGAAADEHLGFLRLFALLRFMGHAADLKRMFQREVCIEASDALVLYDLWAALQRHGVDVLPKDKSDDLLADGMNAPSIARLECLGCVVHSKANGTLRIADTVTIVLSA